MKAHHFERLAIAAIFSILLLALLRQCWPAPEKKGAYRQEATNKRQEASIPESVSADPNDPETIYRYILQVIEKGSRQFHFPGGAMEGGYLAPEEAPKVACYVMELGGHRCPHPYPKDAAMFYTSVCGGCHGNDGKGLHGTYPDLTRPRLLGIEKRSEAEKR